MRKFKLGEEPAPPSDEEVKRYGDFGKVVGRHNKLLHDLHRKPLYRDKRLFLVVLIIGLITYLVWEAAEKDHQHTDPTEQLSPQ